MNIKPWMDLKENEVNKLNTMLQDEEDNNLLDELNLLTERLYSNKQNMLKSENKLWSVDKNTAKKLQYQTRSDAKRS
jgi:hypothetical protein